MKIKKTAECLIIKNLRLKIENMEDRTVIVKMSLIDDANHQVVYDVGSTAISLGSSLVIDGVDCEIKLPIDK